MKVTKQIEHHPCALTEPELLDRGAKLSAVVEDMAAETDRQADERASGKARMAELEAQRTQLCIQIRRKSEPRPVEVECRTDYDGGTYTRIRTDTGEVLSERRLSDAERQEGLPGVSDA